MNGIRLDRFRLVRIAPAAALFAAFAVASAAAAPMAPRDGPGARGGARPRRLSAA